MDLRTVLRRVATECSVREPRNEADIRDAFAAAAREAHGLAQVDVLTEHRVDSKILDVWIALWGLAVEVKYHRPIPSGRNRPMTQQFGDLLADISKLVSVRGARDRLLLLLSDPAGATHLRNKSLFPTRDVGRKEIHFGDIARLAKSARRRVEAEGPWRDVTVGLAWGERVRSDLEGFAWRVEVLAAAD